MGDWDRGGDRFDSIMAFIEGNVIEAGAESPETGDPGRRGRGNAPRRRKEAGMGSMAVGRGERIMSVAETLALMSEDEALIAFELGVKMRSIAPTTGGSAQTDLGFKCTHCDKVLPTRRGMKVHSRLVHKKEA